MIMSLSKQFRRWVSAGVATVLLLLLVTVAAYACPNLSAPVDRGTMASSMMADCEGMSDSMDAEQPQLCRAHCEKDSSATTTLSVVDVQPSTLAQSLIRVLEPTLIFDVLTAGSAALPVLPSSGAPPLYLTLLVLRN